MPESLKISSIAGARRDQSQGQVPRPQSELCAARPNYAGGISPAREATDAL